VFAGWERTFYAAAMAIAGQACVAIKRLCVHDSIYDAVCDELGRLARDTVVGDGLEPGTQMGPIQNRAQFERVKGFLARANETEFGLGGSVWSSDRDRAFRVATRINAGTVWVNKHLDVRLDTPFAGAKQSGIGVEMGQEGLEEFAQATIINVAK
jgi:acyl-CoA reductase-like NAD-dependent aldehyde dehydrogenase